MAGAVSQNEPSDRSTPSASGRRMDASRALIDPVVIDLEV